MNRCVRLMWQVARGSHVHDGLRSSPILWDVCVQLSGCRLEFRVSTANPHLSIFLSHCGTAVHFFTQI